MEHSNPNVKIPLVIVEELKQAIVTRGEGKVAVTEVRETKWVSFQFNTQSPPGTAWTVHEQGTGMNLHCPPGLVPERVKRMVEYALMW